MEAPNSQQQTTNIQKDQAVDVVRVQWRCRTLWTLGDLNDSDEVEGFEARG